MKAGSCLIFSTVLLFFCCWPGQVSAAYHHMGESDTPNFLQAYPDKAATKLDNCVLCHTGGSYRQANGKIVDLGSCQWCHHTFGYDGKGDINATLNPFGKDYRATGRNVAAFRAIEKHDSDNDSFANIDEIRAVRFPGDPKDDPAKVVAPYRIFTRKQLLAMPQHTQLLLMNTAKAVDSYAEFSGVPVEDLLGRAGMASSATRITVYSPDGYAQGHPLEADGSSDPFVKGVYPAATYFYNSAADKDKNPGGWCEYRSPALKGLSPGAAIPVRDRLRLLLALRSEGKDLQPGRLGPGNALGRDSRGPFYLVAPQKSPGPPDQPSNRSKKDVIWPYDSTLDHNGGSSTKCATIIKIEPLPVGTTDIDVREAGWAYIEQEKIVLYGALQGPKLLAPENGDGGVPWNPARFSWEKSPGIDADEITGYRLEYTKDDPSQNSWESLSMARMQTTLVLQPNTTYHWRVRDLDKNGGTTVSTVYHFTTGK
ncbi:MAG: GEGP motif-containing diheme protein [Geobacteraceae bacterium]